MIELGRRILRRAALSLERVSDQVRVARICRDPAAWPCRSAQYLVVGCESSGTTVLAHLLFNDGSRRFLLGGAKWTWDLYMSVYQGVKDVRDYPQLQLYAGLKVPGFAAILSEYVQAFPNVKVVYVVRDPRDVLSSTYRSKRVSDRSQLGEVSWVKETWLGIEATDPVERLAVRWRTYLERSLDVPGVHYVRYEDFCRDKVGTVRELAAAIGIDVNLTRVEQERDRQASHASFRNYAPRGPGSWLHEFVSAEDAKLVTRVCGEHMTRWNYI